MNYKAIRDLFVHTWKIAQEEQMSRWISNAILGITLAACILLPALSAAGDIAVNTSANAGDWGKFDVGSGVIHIELIGAAGERRPMDVLLFYPADKQAYRKAPPAYYSSRLFGVQLDPTQWDPMSWTVQAERAHEGVAIDNGGPSFPLIVVSHGNGGTPEKYAPILERLASHGYVIAAPWHEGNNHDDVLIDRFNTLAGKKILPCLDGLPSPCSDGLNKTLQNRALDITATINTMSSLFGDRVDISRVGFLGHSRGSWTGLAAAGGSTVLNIAPDPRVVAVLALEIATRPITSLLSLQNVTVPTLLVNSRLDNITPMDVSIDAYNTIPSDQKALVILERAVHRIYGSGFCQQMQVLGGVYQSNPSALGEFLILQDMILSTNGTPMDFCFYDSFVNPVDIRPTVETMLGCPSSPGCIEIAPDSVPRSLDAESGMRLALELANVFFDAVLVNRAQPGVHFKQYLSPKFMLYKEGEVVSYQRTESFQGSAVACDDPELAFVDVACGE